LLAYTNNHAGQCGGSEVSNFRNLDTEFEPQTIVHEIDDWGF